MKMSTPNMGDVAPLSHVVAGTPGILPNVDGTVVYKSAVAPAQQPGHTGYLTFATLHCKQNTAPDSTNCEAN